MDFSKRKQLGYIKNIEKTFVKGLELAERFYNEVVAPLMERYFPYLPHSAALIGSGSEVLGFDDTTSQDHGWGLRLQLFVNESYDDVDQMLRENLPPTFLGHHTSWEEAPDDPGTLLPAKSQMEIQHNIEISSVVGYFNKKLHLEISSVEDLADLREREWLSFSEHTLLTLTAGKIFRDDTGELQRARELISYYPDEIWKMVILGEWNAIAEEFVFIGRSGSRGDILGSRILAATICKRIMRLAFHNNRRYVPYTKWFGTGFKQLPEFETLFPILNQVLDADDWKVIENLLNQALQVVIERHIEVGLIDRYDYSPVRFHTREFKHVNWSGVVRQLENGRMFQPIGSVNQITAYTNITAYKDFTVGIRKFFLEILK